MTASQIVKQPLVHFVLIGAALFAAYGILRGTRGGTGPGPDRGHGGRDRAACQVWEKRRLRPPSAEELDTLVAEYIREEVLYREALALGLDRDDAVIRRLLRQKYEFVTEDMAVAHEPDPAKLVAWVEANRERYRDPPRVSFSQVYFNVDRRGAAGEREANVVLADLRNGGSVVDAARSGDGTLLDSSYRDLSVPEVAAMFGQEFADAVAALEPGIWSGPIRSGYGLHLVRLAHRSDGDVPPLQAIEREVRSDWEYEQRRLENDAVYARLLERYDVVFEDASARTVPEGGARP